MAKNAGIANRVAARSQILTNLKDADLTAVRALVGIIDGQGKYLHLSSINYLLDCLAGFTGARHDSGISLVTDASLVGNGRIV